MLFSYMVLTKHYSQLIIFFTNNYYVSN